MSEFVIWSIEHDAWWRPGRVGYTCELRQAGRYTRDEADAILDRANFARVNECAIPVAYLTLTSEGPITDEGQPKARYEDLPDLCTPEDARAFLRVSRNGIYELLKTGTIHSVKFGKLIRIPKAALLGSQK